MSAITPALPATLPPSTRSSGWIISRREDLLWFIGPALVSYLALALMAAGFPFTPIYLTWFILVDGPHVMATITRTYMDKRERTARRWLLWSIVPLMLIGPAAVWAGQASWFFLFAVCWQHYHIAKQHIGFVMLWKAKNKERDPLDLKLDRWFLLASTVLPLAYFVAETRLGWWAGRKTCFAMVGAAYGAFAIVFVARQIDKVRRGLLLNPPKLMLMAVLVPLQWLAFFYAARFGPDGILRAGITLGLFHSFQYHRLLWFHNQNRYSTPEAQERFGMAAIMAKSLGNYLVVAISLHFFLNVLPQAYFPAVVWLQAAIWGMPFTHYLLDSKIWRVRGDKELAAALHL